MFPIRESCAACLLSVALASTASAQVSKTREQVRAEFEAARQSGDLLGSGEGGLTLRELHPQTYPRAHLPVISRSKVRTELAEAQANGETLAAGESGLRLNEVNPRSYPAAAVVASKSRAEVEAEVREAVRNGGLLANGEAAIPLNQLHPQAYARHESMNADAATATATAPMAMSH